MCVNVKYIFEHLVSSWCCLNAWELEEIEPYYSKYVTEGRLLRLIVCHSLPILFLCFLCVDRSAINQFPTLAAMFCLPHHEEMNSIPLEP